MCATASCAYAQGTMFRFLRHAFDAVKMIRTRGSSAILLILLLGAHSAAAVASQHVSLSKDLLTSNGTRAVYAMLAGVPHWRLLPHLWVDKTVSLRWNHGKDVAVCVAPDLAELERRIEKREKVWCGWEHFLGGPDNECRARVTPFGESFIAVADHKDQSHFRTGFACQASVEAEFSLVMLGQTVLGAALYWWAGPLSHSMPFRLSAGSLGFMALSVLILIFMLSRAVPNKRGMAAVATLLGGTYGGLVRYFFGRWIPTFEQLMYSKVALGYLSASGLIGLAVTYYYDDEGNDKLKNILKYGLKMLGLALIATSTSKLEASLALACVMIALDVVINALHLGDASRMADTALHRMEQRFGRSPRSQTQRGTGTPGAALELQEQPQPTPAQQRKERLEDTTPSMDLATAAGVPLPGDGTSAQDGSFGTPKLASIGDDGQGQDSPLVRRGLIFNERTGKTIKIGAATYNKLVLEGYTPDRAAGVLTPPTTSRHSSNGRARRASGIPLSPSSLKSIGRR